MSKLHILIVGDSKEAVALSNFFDSLFKASHVEITPYFTYSHVILRQPEFVFVDVSEDMKITNFEIIVGDIFRVRTKCPDTMFVFLANDQNFYAKIASLDLRIANRLKHYFRLVRKIDYSKKDLGGQLMYMLETLEELNQAESDESGYRYDVALSFAGEQRAFAEELAHLLVHRGVRVFYDNHHTAELWGKNLREFLFRVNSEEARYCVIFVSQSYIDKMWPRHERQTALDAALTRQDDYILPIRIDGTSLPGMSSSIGYVSLSQGVPKIADLLLRKLNK